MTERGYGSIESRAIGSGDQHNVTKSTKKEKQSSGTNEKEKKSNGTDEKDKGRWWQSPHWKIFDLMCFLTGQYYFKNPYCIFLLLPGLVIFGFMNLYSTAFNFYIMTCPYEDCGYIDIVRPKNLSSFFVGLVPMSPAYYSDFQKFVFTCASFSGTLSYFWMVGSLNYVHIRSLWKKVTQKFGYNAKPDGDRSPLLDSDDKGDVKKDKDNFLSPFMKPTSLSSKQVCIFWAIFAFNVVLYIASAVTFFIILAKVIDHNDFTSMKFWDSFGLVSQFVSWFCAILSCFIFSKLAHTISDKCINELYQHLEEVNDIGLKDDLYDTLNKKFRLSIARSDANDNLTFFEVMKDLDRAYASVMKKSLEFYGSWFAIHWVCYTVTAFLAVAYFIQHVLENMYSYASHCHKEQSLICKLSLIYDLLFCLGHCILFLYPCFRAASVTAARYKVIRKISRANWRNIPFQEMQAFLQYMERQDCTFKVSILHANVTFGFNLAYFSIFAGIMTVILKISL